MSGRAQRPAREAKRLRKHVKRIGVFIVGWVIVLAGVIMLITPGPGWAAVFLGLSILATEFTWAERLKRWVQKVVADAAHKIQARRAARRRRRLGIVDEVVEEVLEEVESGARSDRAKGPGNHSVTS